MEIGSEIFATWANDGFLYPGLVVATNGEIVHIAFLDGDYSDNPREMTSVIDPIANGVADFVVGSRAKGTSQPGALAPHQRSKHFP